MRIAGVALAAIGLGLVIRVSPLALVFALPWIAGIACVLWRAGWHLLSSEHDLGTQASKLRGFGAPRP